MTFPIKIQLYIFLLTPQRAGLRKLYVNSTHSRHRLGQAFSNDFDFNVGYDDPGAFGIVI